MPWGNPLDVEAIHEGLATAAGNITGLRAYPALPGSINPPVFAPTEFEMQYHKTFSPAGGMTTAIFTCGIFTSEGDSNAGRKLLLKYLSEAGSNSILAALEADKTLGGKCKTLLVDRIRGAYRIYEIGAMSYLGALIDVKVWA